MYCRYRLEILNSLASYFSHALYLFLINTIQQTGYGWTPQIDTEALVQLLGAESYAGNIAALKRKALLPAIDEISKKADIEIRFEEKKAGNRTRSVKFYVAVRDKQKLALFNKEVTGSNTVTIAGQTIEIEPFVEFLSAKAENKNAYKRTMRQAIADGTLENPIERVTSFVAQQERIIEHAKDEKRKALLQACALTVAERAQRLKGEPLDSLYYCAPNGNRGSFSNLARTPEYAETITLLSEMDENEFVSAVLTAKEYNAQTDAFYNECESNLLMPLREVGAIGEWLYLSESGKEEAVVPKHCFGIKQMLIGRCKKIISEVEERRGMTFVLGERRYLGAIGSNKKLELQRI